jgi:hypothetical protein
MSGSVQLDTGYLAWLRFLTPERLARLNQRIAAASGLPSSLDKTRAATMMALLAEATQKEIREMVEKEEATV